MGTFADDVVVELVEPGRYGATLDHSWDLVAVPQGGIVVALALRAAAAELGDDMPLRTTTAVFAGQVGAGDLTVEVEVLRRGRSAAQLQARIFNPDRRPGAIVTAVFGGSRRGPSFVDVAAPEVPPPSSCRTNRDPLPAGVDFELGPPLPFWQRLHCAYALGHAPWEPHERGASDTATWMRLDDPPLLADGSLDPLALVTLADRMPGCISEALGHEDGPRWFAPSADLTVQLLAPLRTEWVLAHDRARWAGDGWASAESTLYDEAGALVAHASQLMLFTYL